jgi:hypothetical protein
MEYTVLIKPPLNGRPHKATLTARAKDGSRQARDKADLDSLRERDSCVRRLAKELGVGEEGMREKVRKEWEDIQRRHALATEQPQHPQQGAAPERQPAGAAGCVGAGPHASAGSAGSHEGGGPPGSSYTIDCGRICRRVNASEGQVTLVPLCNFTARIVEDVRVDDGSGEVEHTFTVEGALANGAPQPTVSVRATEFGAMNWPLAVWGVRAVVSAGQGSKDHLRAAVQEFSNGAVRRTVYKHTGWRKEEGRWLYLHAGGAIGAEGAVPGLSVQLDGQLAYYHLPHPPEGEDLVAAVRASIAVLKVAPRRLTAPVFGAVWRAPLDTADCAVHVVGKTGVGKSELFALAQQHYGAGMHRRNLPGSWVSTANALEEQCFLAKDALFVIDDFKPGGSRAEVDAWHAKADRVFRSQGNNSARQRCKATGGVRAARPPRGLVGSTGEDVPRGESCRSRVLIVQARKDDVCLQALTPYQEEAVRGTYAQAMAGFFRWLAGHYDEVRGDLQQRRNDLRIRASADGQHPRTPGIIADLALGWDYFLRFALEVGAVDQEQHRQVWESVWAALLAAGAEQGAEIAAEDPCRRFLELLGAAVTSGRAHLAGPDGLAPKNPCLWGWRLEEPAPDSVLEPQVGNPLGNLLGWVTSEGIFLDLDASYAEAQRLGEQQGERLPVSQRQLSRRLKEGGYLASTRGDRATTCRLLQGKERSVLHLPAGGLTPEKPAEPAEPGDTPKKPKDQPPVSTAGFAQPPGKPAEKTGGGTRETGPSPPVEPVPPVSPGGEGLPGEDVDEEVF